MGAGRILGATHCVFGGWTFNISACCESSSQEDCGSYAALLWCLSDSLHPMGLPSLRSAGTWLLHVINCMGETLSDTLSHL